MIKSFDLSVLATNYGGKSLGPTHEFCSVSIDTRSVKSGDLFVAIVGEHFDAHDFLQEALDKGAAGLVILNREYKVDVEGLPVWLVEDTTRALGHIAHYQRQFFNGSLVAITGSSGKTTVKGMLQAILSLAVGKELVFASRGNFNNHIGVPLSLMELMEQHRYAVIEMGASAVGEIDYLTKMTEPNVAMVNNVMPAHVEGFGSIEAIAREKGEIYEGLKEDGVAVVNGDDRFTQQWQQQNRHRRTLIYSLSEDGGDSRFLIAKKIKPSGNGCYAFDLELDRQIIAVQLNVLGKHNVVNALAAASCAIALGLNKEVIAKGLASFVGEPGRLQILKGLRGSTLLDDSYNANPGSFKAAINVLASLGGTTILVQGDMAELGEDSLKQHYDIGEYAAKKGIDYLLVLGRDSIASVEAFERNTIKGEAVHFAAIEPLVMRLNSTIDGATTVLIKGSRSAGMERVVQQLMRNGE